MIKQLIAAVVASAALSGCATYHDVKEIKFVSFSDDLSKGKPSGQIEADDCVYNVMGYQLGKYPDVSTAIANARTGKKAKLTDVAYASNDSSASAMRYVNNVAVSRGGFNAVVLGRTCIEVKGMGYL